MKKTTKMIKMAICYDFDGTLSPQYMQNVSFLPALGYDEPKEFWDEVKTCAKKQNMDETLAYMNLMIDKAKEKNIALTPRFLMQCGKNIQFFPGVLNWFERINDYAKSKGIVLEHYIITSGNEEIIRGTKIKKFFKYIFACKFAYKFVKSELIAEKPAAAVNYTNKTQHLFRINKGIFNYWQNEEVNRYMPEEKKYLDFKNMIYIGDGETDVPCMKMVIYQGGHAIAVYNPQLKTQKAKRNENGKIIQTKKKSSYEVAKDLLAHKRVNFIAPTDYSENSKLDQIVKNIIDRIYLKNVS